MRILVQMLGRRTERKFYSSEDKIFYHTEPLSALYDFLFSIFYKENWGNESLVKLRNAIGR